MDAGDVMSLFSPLVEPKTVAVVGASATRDAVANRLLLNLKSLSFPGNIYVVHPTADEIEGFKTCRSLAEIPEIVDYAYISLPAEKTPDLFVEAPGKVRFAQLLSSGFAEVGQAELQEKVVEAAREAGTRLIGPNSIGLHSNKGQISFHATPLGFDPGEVGVLSQSGGLSSDILSCGRTRGVRFNIVLSMGNCADLTPSDLLEYLLADPGTRVIGLYLESLNDGRRFFEILRRSNGVKPVVILKGGRTQAGQRASASHTGALLQDDRIWEALARQTGAVLVDSLDSFVDTLLLFQTVPVDRGRTCSAAALFGNGGGTSVLATDAFDRAGFEVPQLMRSSLEALQKIGLPAGTSFANPIDAPAGALQTESGKVGKKVLKVLFSDPGVDLVVMHINMTVLHGYRDPAIVPNLVHGAIEIQAEQQRPVYFALVLRSGGEAAVEARKAELRQDVLRMGVPIFDELAQAARSFSALSAYLRFRSAANI